MKGLIDKMVKDYKGEGFTRENFICGAMAVGAIVAVCLIAEFIWTL